MPLAVSLNSSSRTLTAAPISTIGSLILWALSLGFYVALCIDASGPIEFVSGIENFVLVKGTKGLKGFPATRRAGFTD